MLLKFASCLRGCYRACYISCNATVFPSKTVRSYGSNTFCLMNAVRIPVAPSKHTDFFFKETLPEDHKRLLKFISTFCKMKSLA
jgi:hypothetical protein